MDMKKIIILILLLIISPITVFADNNQEEILVSRTTKYYKTTIYNNVSMLSLNYGLNSITEEVSEEEYYNSSFINNEIIINNTVTSETNYKRLTTSIYESGSQYKYETELTWRQMPSKRSYDIIGIGYNGSVTIDGSPSFSQKSCISSNCTTSTTFTRVNSANGISAVFKLPTSTSITSLSQKLSFKVKKNTTSQIISQIAVGDYAHATSTVNQSTATNHLMNVVSGINLSNSISSYYDSMPSANATWNGSW